MIKSSLHDMFRYLVANIDLVDCPLKDVMIMTYQKNLNLYWFYRKYWIGVDILDFEDEQEIVYSGGDTNDHSAYMAFNKSNLTGHLVK